MHLRKLISRHELLAGPAVVILSTPADGPEANALAGKFIVGRSPADPATLVVAFDSGCAFHKEIGLKYGLTVMGGGWCEIRPALRQVRLSGGSTQFGREPDRRLTLALYRAALPDYSVEEEG